MAVNVEIGVDIASFTSGIKQGQSILKGLNAEMKASEAEFKATGNAEKKMESQTKTLNRQLQVQKGIAAQAEAALKRMTDAGIKPTDAAYQKMYAQMMNARAGMNEAQAALNNLGSGAQQAAAGAENLSGSLQGISKKMSLEQVIGGIDKITSGLENAAKKAIHLGEEIFNSIMNSAQWADDTATQAQMFGIDLTTFQQMQALVAGGMDTTVDAILNAQKRLRKGVGDGSVADTIKSLRVQMNELVDTGDGILEIVPKDANKLFFELGQAILNTSDAFDKEAAAQKLFGRNWQELVPLFEKYKTYDDFTAALNKQNTASEESVENLAELNDAFGALKQNFETLKNEVFGEIAPALTKVANALSGVLDKVLEYLKTEKGQELLSSLGDAISSLFSGLSEIDPESVVQSFTSVFNGLIEGLKWISENSGTVVSALGAIVSGWGLLKLTGGALDILKLVNGLKGLGGGGGGGGSPVTTGGGGGGGWFAGIGSKIWSGVKTTATGALKVLPFAAPLALFADGVVHDIQMVTDMMEAGKESQEQYAQKTAQYSDNPLFNSWKTLTDYYSINGEGNAQDAEKMKEFAKHYVAWLNEEVTDTALDEMAAGFGDDDEGQQKWEQFGEQMMRIANGDLFTSTEEIEALKQALETGISALETQMQNSPIQVPTDLKVPDNAAANIAGQVGTVQLPAKFVMMGITTPFLGSHANGLPFVQNDGLAYLHKGERVLTASQNRNYTYNSNNYFGNVNLNNGQDIEALCDRIDRRNRRQRGGYGA